MFAYKFRIYRGDQAKIGRDVFYLTVELWLLYIQPWSVHVSSNSAINYSIPKWMQYIAYNLHFYTTLLPCFLKVISKMNISPLDIEGAGNLDLLNRVLRVFTPDMLKMMRKLSAQFANWYKDECLPSNRLLTMGNHTPRREQSFASLPSPPSRGTPNRHNQKANSSISSPAVGDDRDVAYHCNLLMQDQHLRLFPDPRINELNDYGITDYREYSLEAVASIVICIESIQETRRKEEGNCLFITFQ